MFTCTHIQSAYGNRSKTDVPLYDTIRTSYSMAFWFSSIYHCHLFLQECMEFRNITPEKQVFVQSIQLLPAPIVCFTLADSMPRLASDVVGGKSGRNHLISRRHPIGRMGRNPYIRVGWYEGVVQHCTTPWFVRWRSLIYYNSQLRCTRSAPDRLAASGNIKHV